MDYQVSLRALMATVTFYCVTFAVAPLMCAHMPLHLAVPTLLFLWLAPPLTLLPTVHLMLIFFPGIAVFAMVFSIANWCGIVALSPKQLHWIDNVFIAVTHAVLVAFLYSVKVKGETGVFRFDLRQAFADYHELFPRKK